MQCRKEQQQCRSFRASPAARQRFLLARLMTALLFGVTATDAMTYLTVALTLIIVALIACCIPAWRATKIDPLIALRFE